MLQLMALVLVLLSTHDPETGVVTMAMYNFIPNTGSFGTFDDVFVFDEKPAL